MLLCKYEGRCVHVGCAVVWCCEAWCLCCEEWCLCCEVWCLCCEEWSWCCEEWSLCCEEWCLCCEEWSWCCEEWSLCCEVWCWCCVTHLPSILVLYLCGEVRVQGVLRGKVLQVLTVGQLVAHVHVQQQGGLIRPLGGRGRGGQRSHIHTYMWGPVGVQIDSSTYICTVRMSLCSVLPCPCGLHTPPLTSTWQRF